jgi:hypothetical protein
MNHPDRGWGSSSQVWEWDDLARLAGWEVDGHHADEESDGFWLRAIGERSNGIYGKPASQAIPAPRVPRMAEVSEVHPLPCPDCGETATPAMCSDHPGCPKCTSCGFCDLCALTSA